MKKTKRTPEQKARAEHWFNEDEKKFVLRLIAEARREEREKMLAVIENTEGEAKSFYRESRLSAVSREYDLLKKRLKKGRRA